MTRNESRPGAAAWSSGPNQEEPIRDSAPCPSRDDGGGPHSRGPRDVGPPRCPTRTTAMRTRARSSCGHAGRGLGRAQRLPQMPMTAMVAIPLHSARCRPRHRVTARRARGARGSVRGEGSVSQAWSCQSVQSLPSPYVARIRNQYILIKHVCQMSYTRSGTMSGTIFYPICIVQISGPIWDQI